MDPEVENHEDKNPEDETASCEIPEGETTNCENTEGETTKCENTEGEMPEGETKKTGAGNELKVFAAFMQALDHVLKANHPECMWWTASVSEPTRVSMYQKLVNRAGRRNPEYTDVSMNDAAWPPALKNLIASDRKNKYSILMRNPT